MVRLSYSFLCGWVFVYLCHVFCCSSLGGNLLLGAEVLQLAMGSAVVHPQFNCGGGGITSLRRFYNCRDNRPVHLIMC